MQLLWAHLRITFLLPAGMSQQRHNTCITQDDAYIGPMRQNFLYSDNKIATMGDAWDLSGRKWLYWTAVIGFIFTFQLYLWFIAVILYFTCDRGKPRTQNYQIERVFEKYMIIVGNLGFLVLCALMILLIIGRVGENMHIQ